MINIEKMNLISLLVKRYNLKGSPQLLRIAVVGFLLILLGILGLSAQERVVTGVVIDELGEPAIGATIIVPGTQDGTITDFDGVFSLEVNASSKNVQVSYVGYQSQTVSLAKFTPGKKLVIRLQPANIGLDEVVVVGYGTSKKGDLTGAIASMKSDKIEDRENENVLGSLQGQLAGVEITNSSGAPGGELEVHIRGAASINASDAPLYVVDGIPVDDLSDLNPADIESIDVLKDASSSAIYGSRGANGVLLVKTKTAKENEKLSVNFQASFSLQQMEKKLDVMTPEEWIAWRTDYNNRNYVNEYGYLGATADDDYDLRLAYTGGSVKTNMVNDPRWSMPGYGGLKLIDWQDEAFRLAPKQNYSLSVSGASGKTNYRASIGYTNQEGIAVNTSFERLTARLNLSTKFWDIFTFGINLAPSASKKKGTSANALNIISMVPVAEPEAGIYTGAEPNEHYLWAGSRVSPVAVLEETENINEDFRLNSSAFLRADILDGLKIELTGSYNFRSTQTRSFTPSSISNRWNTGEGYYATANRSDGRSHKYLFQGVINYDKEIAGHRIGVMAGASLESSDSYSSRLTATHFPDNLISDFDMSDVDLTRAYASTGYPVRMLSYFGRLNYDYGGRYLASLSIRTDGSSKFGKDKRWGLFPAASLGWRISQEKFWPENEVMTNLKLRCSWGANGNNSISDGAALGLMSSANYPLGTTLYNGYAPSSLDIPDLTWEKVYSWNWGIDIGMWHNRLTIAADYYRKTTKDLLYEITVPGVMGFSTIWDNIGEVFNEGVELELNTVNLVKPFKWTTSFNLSYNRNEIVNLGENETVFINDNTQVLMVGEPLRSFYMYDAVGVYQYTEDLYKYPVRKGTQLGDVRYRDANDDGVIDDSDRTLVGKPDPDFIFGLTNNFSYKNWDLSVVLTAQTGGYLYSISPGRYIDNPGMGYSQNLFSWWQNCWWSEEEPGDGKTPAIDSTTGELRDTRWLYKSDYLRIKNITLGYRLPLSKKSRYVKGARFYLAVENVWRWDSYPGGYSPENKGNNYYPQARTYSLGASLNF